MIPSAPLAAAVRSHVVTFQDLQTITGYRRRSDVERVLRAQGVKTFVGRFGPWTTLELINAAGGLKPPPVADRYDSDIL